MSAFSTNGCFKVEKNKLIKAIQKAHSGEWAAYIAYGGHWESTKSLEERTAILAIQMEEMEHILVLRRYLDLLGAKPNSYMDVLFMSLGHTLSWLCRIAGRTLNNYGARVMETIGATNYREMALLAGECDCQGMAIKFQSMAAQEAKHEIYFKEKLRGNKAA